MVLNVMDVRRHLMLGVVVSVRGDLGGKCLSLPDVASVVGNSVLGFDVFT